MSEVEILSSSARDFCRTAQHFVYMCESSIQRSEQSVFVISLDLNSMGMRFTAAPVSKFIFTHSNRFGLLVALTSKPPVKTSLQKCHTFVPRLRAIQQNSGHHSIHQPTIVPFVTIPTIVPGCVSGTTMSRFLSEFPSLPPMSSLQDLREKCSMFCPCVSFWYLWIVLRIFLFLKSFLGRHSWTMTYSVCLCHTIACLCSCVHCNLVENVLHRTLNTHHADSMTFFLRQTKKN